MAISSSRTSCHRNMAFEFSHTSKKRIFRYPSSIRIIHRHQVLPFLPDLGDGVPMVYQWWPPILVGEKDDKRWPMDWMGYPILDKPMFEGWNWVDWMELDCSKKNYARNTMILALKFSGSGRSPPWPLNHFMNSSLTNPSRSTPSESLLPNGTLVFS